MDSWHYCIWNASVHLWSIDIFGSSHNVFTPNWVGSGTTKLSGVAYVPLDAKYRAFGFIKSLGGAAEVVAYAEETTDLFKVQGSADHLFNNIMEKELYSEFLALQKQLDSIQLILQLTLELEELQVIQL